jgi:hypothetical protein
VHEIVAGRHLTTVGGGGRWRRALERGIRQRGAATDWEPIV